MAGHAHHHSHDHAHHHALSDTADARKRVAIAALLTFAFMFAEVIGGVISGSLALLADAAHMLTDAGSLGLAWLGFRLAERPADDQLSYGWARFKVLAAFLNGVALLLLAAWIVVEAIQRLLDPAPVMGGVLMGVAVAGLAVNIVAFFVLHGGDREDLNLQGALWHVAGDLLGSVAAIGAAIVIMTTGWMPIDPILSIVVAALICIGGVRISRQSAHILIEGVPPGLEPGDIKADLEANVAGAAHVSHVHAWALTETKPLVTLEVKPAPGADADQLRQAIKDRLAEKFGVSHATVEVCNTPAAERPQCS